MCKENRKGDNENFEEFDYVKLDKMQGRMCNINFRRSMLKKCLI